jgi:NADH dehydrogenase FAD-containing subunit
MKKRLLTGFPGEAQDRAESYLREQGVNLMTGRSIVEVRKDRVRLDTGEERDASVLIWTGGIQPSHLIRALALDKDPRGWLKVTDGLHSPDDERVFGIGDAVSIYDEKGPRLLPACSPGAGPARVAALNISYQIRGRRQIAYVPKTRPQLISLGRDMGILTLGKRVFSGSWVIGLKKAVERKYLMSCLARPVSSAIKARFRSGIRSVHEASSAVKQLPRLHIPM